MFCFPCLYGFPNPLFEPRGWHCYGRKMTYRRRALKPKSSLSTDLGFGRPPTPASLTHRRPPASTTTTTLGYIYSYIYSVQTVNRRTHLKTELAFTTYLILTITPRITFTFAHHIPDTKAFACFLNAIFEPNKSAAGTFPQSWLT